MIKLTDKEQAVVDAALVILDRAFIEYPLISRPLDAADYFRLKLATQERELFCAIFLNTQHAILSYQVLFAGTLSVATVHPRELVKEALRLNAGAVIVAHNHPSGSSEPSHADIALTRKLKDALELVDVRLLDHFVVGAASVSSLAERGLV